MSTVTTADAAAPVRTDAASPNVGPRAMTPAELLDAGKFALYHLEKAKAALASGNIAAAQYQVTASLCHEVLAEATALKAELKKRSKGG